MKRFKYISTLFFTAVILASCGSEPENTDKPPETEASSAVAETSSVTEPAESKTVNETSASETGTETSASETTASETSVSVTETAVTTVTDTRSESKSDSESKSSGEKSTPAPENGNSPSAESEKTPEPESGDVTVTLNGGSAECSSSKVTLNGSDVIIKEEGFYRISGQLSGMIVVSAPKDAKIDIELNNADINNPGGPAIRIDSAEKVKIISAGGSSNSLSDGGSSEACIFSKEDLTLKGDGFIKINGNVKNAVYSKNTLKFTGGSYEISSQNNAVVGKDKVVIENGQFRISCARDAIKSTNENEAGKGTVAITGGSFDINAGDDCIQAISGVSVSGCSITLRAEGKKVNCPAETAVDEGCINKIKE